MSVATYATLENLERDHNGEWVLLDAPEVDDQGWVVGGIPIAFALDADTLAKRSGDLRLRDAAILLLGEWPGDEEFILFL